jgi:DNA repair exonuclease SbcCD ATPase subunit
MAICPICHRPCKTAQGLSGHIRFRHQTTVPKQDLSVYARDRVEKAENENAKLREQVARLRRLSEDQDNFYEKKMAEQKTELEKVSERKLAEQQSTISKQYEQHIAELDRAQQAKVAEQQRVAALKEQEERHRSERARADAKAVADLRKQIQDLEKRIEGTASQNKKASDPSSLSDTLAQDTSTSVLKEVMAELKKLGQDLRQERDCSSNSSPLPPPPDPLRPIASVRNFRRWFFRRDESQ